MAATEECLGGASLGCFAVAAGQAGVTVPGLTTMLSQAAVLSKGAAIGKGIILGIASSASIPVIGWVVAGVALVGVAAYRLENS